MTMTSAEIKDGLAKRLIGQEAALGSIAPYIVAYNAGLNPEARPVASLLLLGPTGTGKTRTVEALADVLHHDETKMLRIDCGQFVLQHEIAKLLGAPPGYLGHRETAPMITQKKLDSLTSEHCPISILLFDEIEKAHNAMFEVLLSILDKAIFSLGDNTTVNFSNTLIFFTSNLGAREMYNTVTPHLGFSPADSTSDMGKKLERIGMVAMRKRFTPEFINRLDEILTYSSLTPEAIEAIFTLAVDKVRASIFKRFGQASFMLVFSDEAVKYLITKGFSPRHGARELSRTIFRQVTQPLSNLIVEHGIPPGAICKVSVAADDTIALNILDPATVDRIMKTNGVAKK